jgi:hypothetical protein
MDTSRLSPARRVEDFIVSENLERQNNVIIALLARSTLGLERISKIVSGGKRNPEAYRRAYNALEGASTVTEVARLAGVAQPTMTVILQSWAEQGIVYNSGSERKPLYHRLLYLPRIKAKKGGGDAE